MLATNYVSRYNYMHVETEPILYIWVSSLKSPHKKLCTFAGADSGSRTKLPVGVPRVADGGLKHQKASAFSVFYHRKHGKNEPARVRINISPRALVTIRNKTGRRDFFCFFGSEKGF